MPEFVSIETDPEGVATLRVDRPPVNALSARVWAELGDAATRLTEDPEVRAVVLWGGAKVFAAGADIKEMADLDFQTFFVTARGLQAAFSALAQMPKVMIAAINGYALGGGCELALTADFRLAASDATLGQPEILLGIIPGAGGTQRLPRLVGVQKAKELVYSGRTVPAGEALEIGLVDRVCEPDQVYEEAVDLARRYTRGPYALRMAKKAIDEGIELQLDAALRLETSLFAATFATDDRRIGFSSFIERGPGQATFTGN